MSGLNKCTFIGNLGKDPECGFTQTNKAFARASIAVSKSWKDRNSGEKKESTEWIPLVFWEGLAEVIGKYGKKGGKIYVEGEFVTRSWEKDGIKRYTTEIVVRELLLLSNASGGNNQRPAPDESQAPYNRRSATPSTQGSGGGSDQSDAPTDDTSTDDLPF